jgi:hypothetical protein
MRPYPHVPLLVVRANMGVGKTVAVVNDYLPHYCEAPDTKVLFITYQRRLARKYQAELPEDFVCYLDAEGTITDNKVIVCLDSVVRLPLATKWDYVIVDEAASVLLHFSSPCMTDSAQVCTRFAHILHQAKHILLMDACADHSIVHDTVEYLSHHKRVQPYFVRNNYVRPTNRQATIVVCDQSKHAAALKARAIKHVLEAMRAGKRVVVPSSNKRFVDALRDQIRTTFGGTKRVLVYTSDGGIAMTATASSTLGERKPTGGEEELRESAGDAGMDMLSTDHWATMDALLYSPAISAGLSFQQEHFHELVAYVENGPFTPPVDTILQQLFRVRQLKDGAMTVYTKDVKDAQSTDWPLTPDDIDQYLEHNLDNINAYLSNIKVKFSLPLCIVGDRCTYNKELLSYHVLRGIILAKNKSRLHYADILANTLREDYGIPITMERLAPDDAEISEACKLDAQFKKMRLAQAVPFSAELLIGPELYEDLDQRKRRGDLLSDMENQQMWTFKCVHEVWRVPEDKVDAAFFDKYIGQADKGNIDKIWKRFFMQKRCREMLHESVEDHQRGLAACVADVLGLKEYSITLYRTACNTHYPMLLEGHKFTAAVFPELLATRELELTQVTQEDFYGRMRAYLTGLDAPAYQQLITVFYPKEADRVGFTDKQTVLEDHRKLTFLSQCIMKGVGVEQKTMPLPGRGHIKNVLLRNPEYVELQTKYGAEEWQAHLSGYSFIDDEDEMLDEDDPIDPPRRRRRHV